MKILVRLPNWLGDMVMSVGLIHQLPYFFPGAELSVIAKKGIHELLSFFPPLQHQFVFDKALYKGLRGAYKFGKDIRKKEKFDLFICLPDSLSSAVMAKGTGAKQRIGYRKEWRNLFLTDSYEKTPHQHRVERYIQLLENFTGKKCLPPEVLLQHANNKQDYIVVNINSEAASRRLTVQKAAEIINALRASASEKILLIGAPKEREFVATVFDQLINKQGIENVAGQTNLPQLALLLASARVMLSTDSGPAHLANALQTATVVLFGAGNEAETAPYNQQFRSIIRLNELSCEPCEKNICVRFGTPQCLERLNTQKIISELKQLQHKTKV